MNTKYRIQVETDDDQLAQVIADTLKVLFPETEVLVIPLEDSD